jgi:hypothetical protein
LFCEISVVRLQGGKEELVAVSRMCFGFWHAALVGCQTPGCWPPEKENRRHIRRCSMRRFQRPKAELETNDCEEHRRRQTILVGSERTLGLFSCERPHKGVGRQVFSQSGSHERRQARSSEANATKFEQSWPRLKRQQVDDLLRMYLLDKMRLWWVG